MEVRDLVKYDDLIKRLEGYSAARFGWNRTDSNGGITKEAADAIRELVNRCKVYEDAAAYWKENARDHQHQHFIQKSGRVFDWIK